eukprot:gene17445-biopygen15906
MRRRRRRWRRKVKEHNIADTAEAQETWGLCGYDLVRGTAGTAEVKGCRGYIWRAKRAGEFRFW